MRDLVQPKPGDRVVDLGCAAGAITHFLASFGCEVVGVDSEPLAIEAAADLFPDLRFELADVTRLPFEDDSQDKAVAADLVEHLDDATFAAMLAEVKRVLVAGRRLSYTPNPLHLVERMKAHDLVVAQNPTHIGLRPARELAAGLEQAGYAIEINSWRPSFVRVLRNVERVAGPRLRSSATGSACGRASRSDEGRLPHDLVPARRAGLRRALRRRPRERLRARGVEVDVVAPGTYRDFGLAYGTGLTKNRHAQAVGRPAPPRLDGAHGPARRARRRPRARAWAAHRRARPRLRAPARDHAARLGCGAAQALPPLLRLLVRRVRVPPMGPSRTRSPTRFAGSARRTCA